MEKMDRLRGAINAQTKYTVLVRKKSMFTFYHAMQNYSYQWKYTLTTTTFTNHSSIFTGYHREGS